MGTKGQFPIEFNTSGIYIIVDNVTGTDAYVGSSIDIANRLRTHFDLAFSSKSEGTEHLLYSRVREFGRDRFTVTPIHSSTNYLSSFLAGNENHSMALSTKDYQLLDAYTKYELAVTEQSYLQKLVSTLNGRHNATTSTHPTLFDRPSTMVDMPKGEPTYVDYVPKSE